MDFPVIPKPPTRGEERDNYRWQYLVCEVLNGLRAIWLDHDKTQNISTVDLTSTDNVLPQHITNAQGKKWEDHVDDVDGNPHGTDWDMLEGSATYIPMDTTPTGVPTQEGVLSWNVADGCIDVQQYNSTTLQVGQELFFYGKASGAILNGDLCQFAGVQGDHILMKRAVPAEIKANQSLIIGVATQNIANGSFGYITWFGNINGVYTKSPANNDSSDWVIGDLLYFNNTTGYLTKVKPDAPNVLVTMAAVIRAQTGSAENGKIIVRPQLTGTFTDLNDVDGVATASGQFYVWDNTNKYFKPTANITVNDVTPTITTSANDLVIDCGTEKTLRLETTVWDDIVIPVIARSTGVGNPDFAGWGPSGGLRAFLFDAVTVESIYGTFEMPHTYEEQTSLDIHVHWTPTTTGGGNVVWAIEYSIVDIDGTFPSPTTAESINAAGTTNWKHLYSDITDALGTGIHLGAVCNFRLFRNASSVSDTYAGDAALVSFGVHIRHDTLGSRTELAK